MIKIPRETLHHMISFKIQLLTNAEDEGSRLPYHLNTVLKANLENIINFNQLLIIKDNKR